MGQEKVLIDQEPPHLYINLTPVDSLLLRTAMGRHRSSVQISFLPRATLMETQSCQRKGQFARLRRSQRCRQSFKISPTTTQISMVLVWVLQTKSINQNRLGSNLHHWISTKQTASYASRNQTACAESDYTTTFSFQGIGPISLLLFLYQLRIDPWPKCAYQVTLLLQSARQVVLLASMKTYFCRLRCQPIWRLPLMSISYLRRTSEIWSLFGKPHSWSKTCFKRCQEICLSTPTSPKKLSSRSRLCKTSSALNP